MTTTRPPQLFEQYRPDSWDGFVGHPKTVKVLDRIRSRAGTLAGRPYWISGATGTGKTTLAHLIAREVADPQMIKEIDASAGFTPQRALEEENEYQYRGMGEKAGRVLIINESHGLRRDTVRQLLVTLERLPSHVCVIFTTTTDGQLSLIDGNEDTNPLLSRCTELHLTRQGLAKPFARRLVDIARAENLTDLGEEAAEKKAYRLVQDLTNNLRRAIQHLEGGALLSD